MCALHCSFFIQVVPCCLHGWHQWFLLYVASCSLGAFAFNNRTHCIRMFPDSVFLTSNRLPLALHSVYALRLLPFFIFWHCVLLLICCSSSRIGFQQQDISFARTIPCTSAPVSWLCRQMFSIMSLPLLLILRSLLFLKVGLIYCAPLLRPVVLQLTDFV